MGLKTVEQAFLQNLFALKVVSQQDALKLYNELLGKGDGRKKRNLEDVEQLQDRVSRMNSQLSPLELQIKTMRSPWDSVTYMGVCNTIEDEASRLVNTFSKSEIALFFALIDELRDYEGEIKLSNAQTVPMERSMTVAENGRAIQKLHHAFWLKIQRRQNSGRQSAGATVTFGPRALLELPVVRNFARQYAQGNVVSSAPRAEEEEVRQEKEDEEEEVIPVRGRKRRGVSRISEEGLEDADEDEDEEDIVRRPSQSQGRRRYTRRRQFG